ncbi:MAG: hypothetical protein ABSF66_11685 [Terriglobales bacterium]
MESGSKLPRPKTAAALERKCEWELNRAGTSGIVVDNGATGAQNIYFSTLLNQTCTGGTGGCAIQTSQSAP